MKDRVYRTPINSTEELKRRIREEFNRIPQYMIERACRSVPERLEMVIQNEGGHIVTNIGMHCEIPDVQPGGRHHTHDELKK